MTTVANVRAYFTGRAGAPADQNSATMTSNLLQNNIIPASLLRTAACGGGNCVADHPWGSFNGGSLDPLGTFRVCYWNLGLGVTQCPAAGPAGSVSPFFGVVFTGLPKKACIALVESISGPAGPPGLKDVNINGTNMVSSITPVPVNPVSATDATNNCGKNPDGSGTVTFIYRIDAPAL
jgi:hypothetical protein